VLDWKDLVRLPEGELARQDIAAVNLACAAGLPGSEQIDVRACLHRLEEWARQVRRYTEACLPDFHRRPAAFNNSEAYFRILCLVTALQRDLGLRYNPAKIPDHAPLDTADVFIHGALFGDGGTCGSMAVVYTAVGRRLGYPLKLVKARRGEYGHLFPRWDLPGGGHWNIEGTNRGLSCHPDDYYRTGLYAVSRELEAAYGLLRPLSATEELADFLAARGFRWQAGGYRRQAVEAFAWASALEPADEPLSNTLKRDLSAWCSELDRRQPPRFSELYISCPRRQFPDTLPLDLERAILGATAKEALLRDPEFEARYWLHLRSRLPVDAPVRADVDFHSEGFAVRFRFRRRWTPISPTLRGALP
jgi:hypothetical protein